MTYIHVFRFINLLAVKKSNALMKMMRYLLNQDRCIHRRVLPVRERARQGIWIH